MWLQSKTKGGLQLHIRAKNREINENELNQLIIEPEIVAIECDFMKLCNCEKCDVWCETVDELKNHKALKHTQEVNEKIEVFALMYTDKVLETRKVVIEKLNEQDDVIEVLKVSSARLNVFLMLMVWIGTKLTLV